MFRIHVLQDLPVTRFQTFLQDGTSTIQAQHRHQMRLLTATTNGDVPNPNDTQVNGPITINSSSVLSIDLSAITHKIYQVIR